MSSSLIKFEVQLKSVDSGSSTDTAYQSFLSSMRTLSTVYQYQTWSYDSGGNYTQFTSCYGLITASQASTALSYLNTLNTSLGYNVPCISYNVTSQP